MVSVLLFSHYLGKQPHLLAQQARLANCLALANHHHTPLRARFVRILGGMTQVLKWPLPTQEIIIRHSPALCVSVLYSSAFLQ